MTTGIFTSDSRASHYGSAAKLARQAQHSPEALNRAVVEFLDLACAWVHLYHPSLEGYECGYLDEQNASSVSERPDNRHESRERLRILCDALQLVIDRHEDRQDFDTSVLEGFPELHEIDIELGTSYDDGRALGNRMLAFHADAWKLLNGFQKRHALSCTEASDRPTSSSDAGTSRNSKRPRATVNQRLAELLQKDPDLVMRQSANTLADMLKCAPSTIKGTETWKTIGHMRGMGKPTCVDSTSIC